MGTLSLDTPEGRRRLIARARALRAARIRSRHGAVRALERFAVRSLETWLLIAGVVSIFLGWVVWVRAWVSAEAGSGVLALLHGAGAACCCAALLICWGSRRVRFSLRSLIFAQLVTATVVGFNAMRLTGREPGLRVAMLEFLFGAALVLSLLRDRSELAEEHWQVVARRVAPKKRPAPGAEETAVPSLLRRGLAFLWGRKARSCPLPVAFAAGTLLAFSAWFVLNRLMGAGMIAQETFLQMDALPDVLIPSAVAGLIVWGLAWSVPRVLGTSCRTLAVRLHSMAFVQLAVVALAMTSTASDPWLTDMTLAGHSARIVSAVASNDSQRIVTGDETGTICIWDAASGAARASLVGHEGAVRRMALSANGKLLATAGSDQRVTIWDVVAGRRTRDLVDLAGDVSVLRFSPDGETLLTVNGGMQPAYLWSVKSGACKLQVEPGAGKGVTWACFSSDGTEILALGGDGRVAWLDSSVGMPTGRELSPAYERGRDVTFSRGRRRALLTGRRSIYVFTQNLRHCVAKLTGRGCLGRSAEFSKTGRLLFTYGGRGETVGVWDLKRSKFVGQVTWDDGRRAMCFMPGGTRVVSARGSTAYVRHPRKMPGRGISDWTWMFAALFGLLAFWSFVQQSVSPRPQRDCA